MTNGVILFFITNIPFTRRVDASESCNCQLKKCAALLRMCFFCCTFAASYKLGIVSNL